MSEFERVRVDGVGKLPGCLRRMFAEVYEFSHAEGRETVTLTMQHGKVHDDQATAYLYCHFQLIEGKRYEFDGYEYERRVS
jgi:hypothetical protein